MNALVTSLLGHRAKFWAEDFPDGGSSPKRVEVDGPIVAVTSTGHYGDISVTVIMKGRLYTASQFRATIGEKIT